MTYYILDTDHLSLYQRSHPRLMTHIAIVPPDEIAITIVTVEEQLRGRLTQIKKAASGSARIQAYWWLWETVDLFREFTILHFDAAANAIYESLRQQGIRIGTQDLRIAAIVLAVGGILVTRNQSDFGQVPGLILDDWTR